MGRTYLVGVPLDYDYQIDARLSETISLWDKSDKVEVLYTSTPFESFGKSPGRDKIVSYAKYRVPNPSHILFLDKDVLPKKTTLDRLLKHDKDIVTGVYLIPQDGEFCWNVSRSEDGQCVQVGDLPREPFKAQFCTMGVVLIKYEVFEQLEWPYWKNEFSPRGIEVAESVYFCRKAIEAGFDIWCDPLVKCNSFGRMNYLNLMKQLLSKEN